MMQETSPYFSQPSDNLLITFWIKENDYRNWKRCHFNQEANLKIIIKLFPLCVSHKKNIIILFSYPDITQIARFMEPTWGPPGSCGPQMGPMLVPWTLLSGLPSDRHVTVPIYYCNTMRSRYITVILVRITHERYPISCPWGQGMGCPSWMWGLIEVWRL